MGKSWDTDRGGRDNWIKWMCEVATECKRVLKPGGHAFVWAIPRTSHWTATAWENAGFEIRDVVAHIFGSGFPKSANVQKHLQKMGSERADEFSGWGSALKPAREDWLLMRKPLEKGLTIAENVLEYGTGGINIDESRVEAQGKDLDKLNSEWDRDWNTNYSDYADKVGGSAGFNMDKAKKENAGLTGRFPANLIHDNSEEVRECFPETGKSSVRPVPKNDIGDDNARQFNDYGAYKPKQYQSGVNDNGGNASRFFKSIIYQAKSSKADRSSNGAVKNSHPTVKSVALMEYLIKMVTPKGGTVLDPFAGSGSTLVAAKQNGFQYIGIEMTEEYIPIIEARLKATDTKRQETLL